MRFSHVPSPSSRILARIAASDWPRIARERSVRSSRPYSSMKASSSRPPTSLQATLAITSPITCSGTRTLVRMISSSRLVEAAFLVELADGDADALVIDLHGRGAEARSADIGQVRDAERIGDDAAVAEHRPHHGDVVEMARALPRVVGHDDVAGLQRLRRVALQHVPQRDGRAADEHRHAEGALRDRVCLRVEDHAGEVVALVDDGGERRAHQRRDDLVDDGDEAVPHDAEADRVEGSFAHGVALAIKLRGL